MLNTLPGVTSVHSRFYDLSSKYYQTVGNHAAYYKDALRFLGCIEVKDLPGNSCPGEIPPSTLCLIPPAQISALAEVFPLCHFGCAVVDPRCGWTEE